MRFPETRWTILADATLNGDGEGRAALDKLCRDYWKPVAASIRSAGAPAARVEDLTQDFFVQLMKRSFFKRADPERGRFRSFMLTSLRLFLADDVKYHKAAKRGGGAQQVEFDETAPPPPEEDNSGEGDAAFDRVWAESLFDRALGSVAEHVLEKRGEEAWAALRAFLPGGDDPLAYPALAAVLGTTSAGAKTEVFRVRQRFREAIRTQVGRTVSAPHEVDEELAYLRAALAESPGRS